MAYFQTLVILFGGGNSFVDTRKKWKICKRTVHALKELPGAATESTNPKIDLTVGIIFIYIRVNFRLLSREYFNEMSPTDRVRFEKKGYCPLLGCQSDTLQM